MTPQLPRGHREKRGKGPESGIQLVLGFPFQNIFAGLDWEIEDGGSEVKSGCRGKGDSRGGGLKEVHAKSQ